MECRSGTCSWIKALRYDSGGDSGTVPCSGLGKESDTVSGKNLGKHPGKKLGKKLPDWVKTRVRRPCKIKMCETRRLLFFE
jgi:hypothetical protein